MQRLRDGLGVEGVQGFGFEVAYCDQKGVSGNEGYLILGSLSQGSYHLGYYIRVPYFRKPPNKRFQSFPHAEGQEGLAPNWIATPSFGW